MIDSNYSLRPEAVSRLGQRFAGRRVGGPLDGATPGQLELAQDLAQRGIIPRPKLCIPDAEIRAILAAAKRVDFSHIKGDPSIKESRTVLLKGIANAAIAVSDHIIQANRLEVSHGPHHFYSKTHAIPVGGNTRGFDPETVAAARALERTAQTGLSYGQLRGDPGDEHHLAIKIQLYPLSTYSLRKAVKTEITDAQLIAELVGGMVDSIKTHFPPARVYFNYQYLGQPGYSQPGPVPITGFAAILNPSKII